MLKNTKEKLEYLKKYYQKNKDKIKARNLIHYKNNKDIISKRTKEYRDKNPGVVEKYMRKRDGIRPEYDKNRYKNKSRDKIYKKKYNISLDDYNKMFEDQKGCCLGCNRHQSVLKRTMAVDHCHKTGKVRGLLCTQCNVVLGYINDNVEVLSNLITYLNK